MDEQTVKQFRDYMIEAGRREREKKYEKYRRLNAFCEKGQILFTGSSLMEQFPVAEMAQGLTKKKVYNRGVGGSTSYEFLDHIDAVLFDLEPSVVFLNIGTNDLSRPDYTHEGLKERYRSIFSQIATRLPQTKVYFMAFYPMNEGKMPHPMAFGLRAGLALVGPAVTHSFCCLRAVRGFSLPKKRNGMRHSFRVISDRPSRNKIKIGGIDFHKALASSGLVPILSDEREKVYHIIWIFCRIIVFFSALFQIRIN